MSDWFHNLPVVWMAFFVFGFAYLLSAAIYTIVMMLAVGDRSRSFKSVSPGMLPPLGIIFGLFVGFTAAQVWSDSDRASAAVDREASALRSVTILAAAFPGEPQARLRALIGSYVAEATSQEWPLMAHRAITLRIVPHALAEALQLTLGLDPAGPGQQTAQREITSALENAMAARRERVMISRSEVSGIKWCCLYLQAICALIAIALVHSDNRLASAITMFLFATGVAAAVLLIASHDRPFIGEISVGPDPLLRAGSAADHTQPETPQLRRNLHPSDFRLCTALRDLLPNRCCQRFGHFEVALPGPIANPVYVGVRESIETTNARVGHERRFKRASVTPALTP